MGYLCKNKTSLVEVYRVMCEVGVDLKTGDERGETPLMFALKQGCHGLDVVKVLVEAGSDVNKRDKWGKSVLSRVKS